MRIKSITMRNSGGADMSGTRSGELRSELDRTGYLVLEDVLDPERDLRPLLDEFAEVLDRLAAKLHSTGKIESTYAELAFDERLIAVTHDAGVGLAQNFDITLPQFNIREDTPVHTGPACFNVLTNERLLEIAGDLIGGEILVSPVGHIRMKLPVGTLPAGTTGPKISRSPWHQDNGVVLADADASDILTVWVAINEATAENGCMQVVPTPRSAGLMEHCPSPILGAHIPDRNIPAHEVLTLPMSAGSVLMMHPKTLHASLENTTANQVRISMDLRYQPVGQPTGRPVFPSFVARSRSMPSMELRDPREWTRMWDEARFALARHQPPPLNRWDPNSALCA
jgi:phytanoyl-CoA hydroxylase